MTHKYLNHIKEAVHAGIWEQLCPEWFVCTDDGKTLKFDEWYIIKKVTADIEKENQLDGHFIIEFENLKVEHVKLSEDFLYQSFYCNEKVYSIAKPVSCILLDIALAKGDPEAIAESFVSMQYQQQPEFFHTGLTLSLEIEQKSTKHPKLLIMLKVKKDIALFFSIKLTWLFCLV